MRIESIKRTHYLESCTIEGNKGYFSEWEIKIESGAAYGFILDLCQKYLSEKKFTKKQFIEGLEYFAERIKDIHHRPLLIVTSFYELLYDKDRDVWIYKVSSLSNKFFDLKFFKSKQK